MKKLYMEPKITVVNVQIGNLMIEVSGETNSGTADSRSNTNWDEE